MQTDSERNANGMLPNTQHPLPNNPIPTNLFDEFWEAFPHREGKKTKKQSLAWWGKQNIDTLTMVLEATKKYSKYLKQCKKDGTWVANPPDPIRYLQNEHYLDELKVKEVKKVYYTN
jgi:hypothetical protein